MFSSEMFTWLFEFEFGDVTDAVVRRVTAVCDLEGVPSLGLTGRILINKYRIRQSDKRVTIRVFESMIKFYFLLVSFTD